MKQYTTYYIGSSGQPANNEQSHATLDAALDSWLSNCGALLKRAGGVSVIKCDGDDMLVWLEHCNGAYLSVDAMALDGDQGDDVSTPVAVYNLYKASCHA